MAVDGRLEGALIQSFGRDLGSYLFSKLVAFDTELSGDGVFDSLTAPVISAGANGTTGVLEIYPATAAKGHTRFTATSNVGDTTTTITVASQSGAASYVIPDIGESCDFVMAAGDQLIKGNKQFSAGDASGALAINFSGPSPGTNTQGPGFKVISYDLDLTDLNATFSPAAITIPAGAILISAQAVILTTVVAGGTTVKVALGINDGDVDGYGITDDLAIDSGIDTVVDGWTAESSELVIDLCGVVSNGSALGDSDITAGSVKIHAVYLELKSLVAV